MIMKKITTFFVVLLLTIQSHADTVTGASLDEIHTRAFGGVTAVLNLLKVVFVLVGFGLFGHSVIRLIKISRGEIQGASATSAFVGMAVASMLSSLGFWWIVTSESLKAWFTS